MKTSKEQRSAYCSTVTTNEPAPVADRLARNSGYVAMKGRPAPKRTPIVDGRPLPDVLDEEMIHAVVHGFYDLIRQDDLVGPIFNRAIAANDWPHHLAKMCDFWSATLLRTGRYEGRPLVPHLAIPKLDEVHFRRWLTLFETTVARVCPAEVAALFMDRAMRVAHSFRLAIAFNQGQNTMTIAPITKDSLRPSSG